MTPMRDFERLPQPPFGGYVATLLRATANILKRAGKHPEQVDHISDLLQKNAAIQEAFFDPLPLPPLDQEQHEQLQRELELLPQNSYLPEVPRHAKEHRWNAIKKLLDLS